MDKQIFAKSFLILVCVAVLFFGTAVFAQSVPQIQTNSATNVQSNSATLNASVVSLGGDNSSITVWFQWGTSTSYGNSTPQQNQNGTGSFSQTISNLNSNTTYHFQTAAQNRYGIVYGQDMTFYTNSNGQVIVGSSSVQTNSATNIQNNSATLNGNLLIPYISSSNNVWFQYGTDTNYGNTTGQQTINSGSFSQTISNLSYNATYHFRAVGQISGSTYYGQDMTFYTSGSGNYYNGNGSGALTITKQVIDLTSGNLNWQPSVTANPGDILSFAITMQSNGGRDAHNVFVRDNFPPSLIYRGNMTVNASLDNVDNPVSGINVGTIQAGGIEVISYQVQVDPSAGGTNLSNNATISSTEGGSQTASASVNISNSQPYVPGPTNISTGQTNNPITDSFFLPMLLIVTMSYLYFTGKVYAFADWIDTKIS